MYVHNRSFFVISDRPNEDEIKAKYTTSDEVFAVVIFQKVYPQPKCVLVELYVFDINVWFLFTPFHA